MLPSVGDNRVLTCFRLPLYYVVECCFFFQAEDGIRDLTVTGVQTCALPISLATIGTGSLSRRAPSLFPHRRNSREILAAWSTQTTGSRYLFSFLPLGHPMHRLSPQVAQSHRAGQVAQERSGPATKFQRAVSVRCRQAY